MNSPFDMNSFATFSKINNSTAGYLSVEMNDPITSKLTVTKRSGIAKFIFKDSNEGSIIIGSGINSSDSKYITEAMIKITSNSSCEGFTKGGEFCGTEVPYKIYFAAEFDRPASKIGTWNGRNLSNQLVSEGRNSGGIFTFDTSIEKNVAYGIHIGLKLNY